MLFYERDLISELYFIRLMASMLKWFIECEQIYLKSKGQIVQLIKIDTAGKLLGGALFVLENKKVIVNWSRCRNWRREIKKLI